MKHWLHLGFLLCAMWIGTVSAWARPELNAFLNRPVHSVDELVKQMRSDPAVLARYRKHYKMNKEELTAWFKTFRLISMPESKYYLTFNVDHRGVIRSKKVFYPRGTKVFVDRQGVPMMKRSCGNPTSYGPKGLQRVAFTGNRKQTLVPEPPLDPAEFGFAPEPILLAALPIDAEPAEMPETVAGSGVATPGAGSVPAPAAVTPPPAVLPGVLAFNPIPWLVGTGIIIGYVGGGGGNDDGVIPEPASIFALALGAAYAGRKRKVRRGSGIED
jgi:hypothetical protein